MDYAKIEPKWQKKWEESGINRFDPSSGKPKYYVLEMFSYPSASNLHLGHWYNYGISDVFARFKKMQGYNVFQPMGFDAFGLPAENYAIKTGIHPKDSTYRNMAIMEKQLAEMGAMFDFGAKLYTCSPEYYKWTQWLFLQLYKQGYAYQKEAPVNWCSSCNTVIANEQVIDGCCERCHSEVIKRNLTQWFFKTTAFAEELLEGLNSLDWPEKTKLMQKNWIGKSTGAEITFKQAGGNNEFNVFTTRADTLFGVSFVTLAPEHPLAAAFTTPENKKAVEEYIAAAGKSSEIERLNTEREKTGVFTGGYVINPANNQKVPVWIADYVLYTYGTGAVMAVPAHDTRDYAFAVKYNLPISRVISAVKNGAEGELPFTADGFMVGSGKFSGLGSAEGRDAVIAELAKTGAGAARVNYRLRDWSVSRQRYWGAPIPMIYCDKCGAVPVPESDLPVELPYNVNFTPDGKSPLASNAEFINVTCPECGGAARREADTLDTFVCSSWYHLRYPDASNAEKPFDSDKINRMLPVDKYVGGAEHACMHLLYARFVARALNKMGYINFTEPFTSLVHQGLILGRDGNKMSKSLGNVVNPDIYVREYGSDVLRIYLMFGFNYIEGGPWNDDGIKAAARFLERAERLCLKLKDVKPAAPKDYTEKEQALDYALNYAVKHITADINAFSFNTAVARLMELVNAMYKYDAENGDRGYLRKTCAAFLRLIAPLAPHTAEELHEIYGGKKSVFTEPYPVCDETKLTKSEVEIMVQINSRPKMKLNVPSGLNAAELEKLVRENKEITDEYPAIKKVIAVPGRLVNIIV